MRPSRNHRQPLFLFLSASLPVCVSPCFPFFFCLLLFLLPGCLWSRCDCHPVLFAFCSQNLLTLEKAKTKHSHTASTQKVLPLILHAQPERRTGPDDVLSGCTQNRLAHYSGPSGPFDARGAERQGTEGAERLPPRGFPLERGTPRDRARTWPR